MKLRSSEKPPLEKSSSLSGSSWVEIAFLFSEEVGSRAVLAMSVVHSLRLEGRTAEWSVVDSGLRLLSCGIDVSVVEHMLEVLFSKSGHGSNVDGLQGVSWFASTAYAL